MMPGTGCCALTDTVRLTEHATKAGCAGVLMLPPFYYKDVSEEGLYRSFAEVIERVGDARLRIYLYHIPPVAVVGITPKLVERLLKAYPSAIAGMKDSSGDWGNTKLFLDAFAKSGFDVFVGSETFLLQNMQAGGAGCISATANVNPAAIDKLYREWRNPDAALQQETLNAVRKATGQYVMIPALKAVVAHYARDPVWATVRPPLVALPKDQAAKVIEDLEKLDFEMPGLRKETATA
jgi:4-hydroxy-tetrahydrodipicolinate synthase